MKIENTMKAFIDHLNSLPREEAQRVAVKFLLKAKICDKDGNILYPYKLKDIEPEKYQGGGI